MSDLLLDQETNDLKIVDGELLLLTDPEEEAKQAALFTLKAFRGEWFRNFLYGTPWIKNDYNSVSILNKVTKDAFHSYVRQSFLSNDEITEVSNYSSTSNPLSGEVNITCTVHYDGGQLEISENLTI